MGGGERNMDLCEGRGDGDLAPESPGGARSRNGLVAETNRLAALTRRIAPGSGGWEGLGFFLEN